MTVEEAVQNGIDLLDGEVPEWLDYIDLDKLNMYSPYDCVLGHVGRGKNPDNSNANWHEGKKLVGYFGEDTYFLSAHGFDASYGISYTSLGNEWKKRIIELRGHVLE